MVRYLDPEHYPELGEDYEDTEDEAIGVGIDSDVRASGGSRGHSPGQKSGRRRRISPAERIAAMREKNAALTGVEAIEAAREVALRQLDTRSRSRAELHAAIIQRGFPDAVAEDILNRLEGVGLIDDAAFAAMVVRERFTMRGATGRAVREELQRKGIDPAIIAQAMSHISEDDAYERARELAHRKVRNMSGVDRHKAWGRLSGMLARKGYSFSICQRVITEVLENWEEDQEE